MRVLLETESAIVGFDEAKRAMIVIWSDFGNLEEFATVYNNVLKGFKIFFTDALVNDMGAFGKFSEDNRKFLKNIFPMLTKCGMRKFFSVNTHDDDETFLASSINNLKNRCSKEIIFQSAKNFNAAFEDISSSLK